MEIRAKNFGGMQQIPTTISQECHIYRNARRRQRSGIHKDMSQKQVICPEPRRAPVVDSLVDELHKTCCWPPSNSMVQDEGDAGREILDIFLRKSGYGDSNGSVPYFCGSPPVRAHNPLVNDVKFVRKDLPSPSVSLTQKSSCGASYGTNPSVRVEGFACSSSEKQCIVPALA
ncbi:hypothetical protein SUGI_0973910 [Cryptomeria japonica]|uniref:uncharacterized protein LOC131073929 n=1 Tax=Cryptomeria japonica TaxID=3369 RepID=UPI0024146F37|nr:uncharacterized protein LOC131073929 [Cryptomeria japonica]GLJ46227.1 hypothetical protein SUGI_0973910 [Cryptomeria japonica]